MKKRIYKVVIFFTLQLLICFHLIGEGLNAKDDFIDIADKAYVSKEYATAYNYYLKAEDECLKNNVSPKDIYFKMADLCKNTYNYDSAIFYLEKYSKEADDKNELNKVADKILEIYEVKTTNSQPKIDLTKKNKKKLKPAFLKKIKAFRGRYDFSKVCKMKQQTYRIKKPVAVVGVRGADELHLDAIKEYNNLQVNLEYFNFSDNEIRDFKQAGSLTQTSQRNKKDKKFHLTELIVSEEEEIKNGEQTAQILINSFRVQNRYCELDRIEKYPIEFNDNEFSNKDILAGRIYYINLLLKVISAETRRPDLKYKVDIFFDENINAFTTTSGYIFISEEFLKILDNEDELAAVLAHELSHIAKRHHGKSKTKTKAIDEVASLFLKKNKNKNLKKGVELLNKSLIKNSFERGDEYEADLQAVKYLLHLGYNPFALINVLDKFNKINRIRNKLVGSFLNNHPQPSDRIQRIRQFLMSYDETQYYNDSFFKRRERFEGFIMYKSEVDLTKIKTPPKSETRSSGVENKIEEKSKKEIKKLFKKWF